MVQSIERLEALHESVVRMRQIAVDYPTHMSPALLRLAERIAQDAADLEHELIGAGIDPKRQLH